jgi:hypothetical protein
MVAQGRIVKQALGAWGRRGPRRFEDSKAGGTCPETALKRTSSGRRNPSIPPAIAAQRSALRVDEKTASGSGWLAAADRDAQSEARRDRLRGSTGAACAPAVAAPAAPQMSTEASARHSHGAGPGRCAAAG